MPLTVYDQQHACATIKAGLVTILNTCLKQGIPSADFVDGVLTMAQHEALAYNIPWSAVLDGARDLLCVGDGCIWGGLI